jgi:hypothetical protein
LPSVIEDFALEEAELMGVDPAGLAVGALAVCAGASPDRVKLRVKKHDPHWLECARIWVALVGDPSTKRSPTSGRVADEFIKLDTELARRYLDEKEVYDSLGKEERQEVEAQKRSD